MRTPSRDLRGRADDAAPEPPHPCTTRAAPSAATSAPGPSPTISPVGEPDGARAARGEPRLVGDEDDGVAAPVQLVEEPDDLLAGGGVEVAGGLVGEEERGLAHERAGDGDALALAAGELVRLVVHAVREPDRRERRLGRLAPLAARQAAVDERAAPRSRARWRAGGAGRSGRRSRSPCCAGPRARRRRAPARPAPFSR